MDLDGEDVGAFDDDDLVGGELVAVLLPGAGEEQEFDAALDVFDGDEAHRLVGFGRVRAHGGDEARDANFFFMRGFAKLTGEITDDLRQSGLIFIERMIGDVKPDELALPVEHLALVHVVDFGQADLFNDTSGGAKETHLPGIGGAEVIAGDGNNAVERGKQRSAIAE